MDFIVSVLNWAIKIKSKETDYTVSYWIPMREENSIEVAISLLWNVFVLFIFLSRMESTIPVQWDTIPVTNSVSTKNI